MRIDIKPFPITEIQGSFNDMGKQYGQDMKEEIVYMVKWWGELLQGFHPNFSKDKGLSGAIAMFETPIESTSSRWIEFMKGIGEGAGVDWREIYWLNVASNLLEGQDWAMKPKPLGCTSFAIEPSRTSDNKTYIGMNLDWTVDLKVVCVHMKPIDAPEVMGFCFAGCLPQLGISSKGFATMINGLTREFNKSGLPMNVICANALLGNDLEEACQAITLADRAMSFNHLLAGSDGAIVDIETTADNFQCLVPEKGRLVHTNHYVTPWLQEGDLYKANVNTFTRKHIAEEHIDNAEVIDLDHLKSLLRDHKGAKTCSICSHNTDVAFHESWASILSVIAIPEDGVMYATEYPCENDFVEYRM
mgnify:CR=1 FL=1